jgi:Mrp family chromosome partitioning ATPase
MGRTLDTLRHGEPQRASRSPAPQDAPTDGPPEGCVVDWTLQDEVPFVEVGDKGVELSPLLVKHPPQPPHPPRNKGLASPKAAPPINLTEAKPMAVAFEAWPGPAAPAGVAPEVIAYHQPEHPVGKEYAGLFETMVRGLASAGPHVLMLAGLKPRVGTSTVLLNLAVVAARLKRRVAAVDANLARPGLAARLGHAEPAGMRDVVAGSLALDQALVPTAVPELKLLPAGCLGKRSGPLSAAAITWLLAWLRERFDVVLIDGPCAEDAAELALLAPGVDGIYMVLPQGETDAVGRGVAQSIARMGGRLRGLIHTRFE